MLFSIRAMKGIVTEWFQQQNEFTKEFESTCSE